MNIKRKIADKKLLCICAVRRFFPFMKKGLTGLRMWNSEPILFEQIIASGKPVMEKP